MDYILGHTSAGSTHSCFLCTHPTDAAAFRENLVLVAQEHAFVGLNRYPFSAGHLLVSPRRHVADFSLLTAEEYLALATLLRESAERLKRALHCEAMNVGFNIGKHSGGSVSDHLHGHVVPRWAGDVNFMPVIADVRIMPQYLDEVWQRMYPAFSDLEGVHPQPAFRADSAPK